jgi:ribonuclease VapC
VVIDSSALLAIALDEPEAERMLLAITADPVRLMSSVNWLEIMMVAESRRGANSANAVLAFMTELEIGSVPFDLRQMKEAREAWRRYGKGRHPAGLNMGDCCAYAAAIVNDERLLFKGNDFSLTDVPPAEW